MRRVQAEKIFIPGGPASSWPAHRPTAFSTGRRSRQDILPKFRYIHIGFSPLYCFLSNTWITLSTQSSPDPAGTHAAPHLMEGQRHGVPWGDGHARDTAMGSITSGSRVLSCRSNREEYAFHEGYPVFTGVTSPSCGRCSDSPALSLPTTGRPSPAAAAWHGPCWEPSTTLDGHPLAPEEHALGRSWCVLRSKHTCPHPFRLPCMCGIMGKPGLVGGPLCLCMVKPPSPSSAGCSRSP